MDTSTRFVYRVTGVGARKRFVPVLEGMGCWREVDEGQNNGQNEQIDFVYETTVSKEWKEAHEGAKVRNSLSGSRVLEDKAALAHLLGDEGKGLESYVLEGVESVRAWAEERWAQNEVNSDPVVPFSDSESCENDPNRVKTDDERPSSGRNRSSPRQKPKFLVNSDPDWWCLKAARGNGGLDVWVLRRSNAREVLGKLNPKFQDCFVVQRYVARPMLSPTGHKFHFRSFLLVRANLSSWLYKGACTLTACERYTLSEDVSSDRVHLTNLSVSKMTGGRGKDKDKASEEEGGGRQGVCDLERDYPSLWPKVMLACAEVVESASPYMLEQKSPHHFELYGADVLVDDRGEAWLLELNRMPGMASTEANWEQDEAFYNGLVRDVVSLVVAPVLGLEPQAHRFEQVTGPHPSANVASKKAYVNTMRLAAYLRKKKRKV